MVGKLENLRATHPKYRRRYTNLDINRRIYAPRQLLQMAKWFLFIEKFRAYQSRQVTIVA